jgi:hypothetical protein
LKGPDCAAALARAEAIVALPAMLALLRRVVTTSFEPGDPESDELRDLLDACVVSAHRLRLRERLRDRQGGDRHDQPHDGGR